MANIEIEWKQANHVNHRAPPGRVLRGLFRPQLPAEFVQPLDAGPQFHRVDHAPLPGRGRGE